MFDLSFRSFLFFLTIALALVMPLSASGSEKDLTVVYLKLNTDLKAQLSRNVDGHILEDIDDLPGVEFSEPLSYNISSISSRQAKVSQSKYLKGISKVNLSSNVDVVAWLKNARSFDNVVYAERETNMELLLIPNDVQLASQVYLETIKAIDAWDLTRGDSTIVVGISDGGVDYNHEDLQSKLAVNHLDPINGIDDDGNGYIDDYFGWDLADGDNDPMADTPLSNPSHGTMVAGIACADTNNGLGIAGVGFDTKFMPIKIFSSVNGFSNSAYQSIIYAADMGLDVLNLSWGSRSTPSLLLQDIINYAVLEKDMVIVAAAGNNDDDLDYYPASYDHVLSVAMSNLDDSKHSFGTYSYNVDLMAPGNAILSTKNNDNYGSDLGSSYAAPQVAGAAALVKSVFPELSAIQVMEQIRVTSDDVYEVGNNSDYYGKLGHGRLNVYNAVTQTEKASIRSFGYEYSGEFGEELYGDETVTLNVGFVNVLRAVNNAEIRISTESSYAEVLSDELSLGSLNTMDSIKNLSFQVRLKSNIPEAHKVGIRLEYSDALGYSDFEYLTFTTSADYLLMTNDNISFLVDSDGRIGYAEGGLSSANGLMIGDESLGNYFGFMVGKGSETLIDNVINDYGELTYEDDFEPLDNVKFKSRENVDVYSSGSFVDSGAANEIGLLVEQEYYMWAGEEENDFAVIEYRITNTKNEVLKNLNLGLFMDFDLGDIGHNFVSWDEGNHLGYTFSEESDLKVGLSLITNHQALFTAIDLFDSLGLEMDIDSVFTDEVKFNLFTKDKRSAGGEKGTNVGELLGTKVEMMDGLASEKIAFALVFGESVEELIENHEKAQTKYTFMINNPPLNWVVETCGIDSVSLANENNVSIYSDPLATNLVASGVDLSIGVIDHDSTLYYREIDSGYESDVYSLLISIAAPETKFKANPSLLYLGDYPNNTVQFEDLSSDAVTWEWDFGNGSFSTLQHPKTSFQEVGVYQVNLNATTHIGCQASVNIPYEVKERGVAPEIADQVICKGSSAIIKGSKDELINIYIDESISSPAYSGDVFTTPILTETTTYFISSIESDEESVRIPVEISIDPVQASFQAMPDTLDLNSNNLMRITDQSEFANSISWEVQGQSQESVSTFTYNYTDLSTIDITLTVESDIGCESVVTESIGLTASNNGGISGVTICEWESVWAQPLHGDLFIFYGDENRTEIIGKGSKQIFGPIGSDTTFYIANISNFLESDLISFEVKVDAFDTEIVTQMDSTAFGSNPNIQFSIDNPTVTTSTWYLDGTLAAIDLAPTFTFSELKNYEVLAISGNQIGCTDSAQMVYSIYEVLGVKELLRNIMVYPIPANNELHVDSPYNITTVEIVDILGRSSSLKATIIDDGSTFDISHYAPGVYTLILDAKNEKVYKNIIIE